MMAALDFYFQVRLLVFNIGLLDETFTEQLEKIDTWSCLYDKYKATVRAG